MSAACSFSSAKSRVASADDDDNLSSSVFAIAKAVDFLPLAVFLLVGGATVIGDVSSTGGTTATGGTTVTGKSNWKICLQSSQTWRPLSGLPTSVRFKCWHCGSGANA